MPGLNITPRMVAAGAAALYRHAKEEPDLAVVAIFRAMVVASPQAAELEAASRAQRPRHSRERS